MFKVIIIYELFFFFFWNIIYWGADLKDFAQNESLAFIYYILVSMALGWVIINTIKYYSLFLATSRGSGISPKEYLIT